MQLHSSLSQVDKITSLLAYVNTEVIVRSGEALLIEWNMGFKNPSGISIEDNTEIEN